MHNILTILRLSLIVLIPKFLCRSNKHVNEGKIRSTNTNYLTCAQPSLHAIWQSWIAQKSSRFARGDIYDLCLDKW